MILVGDIGGTRTRLALAAREGSGWRLDALEESPTPSDVVALVRTYLSRQRGATVEAAAFCGAGPVGHDGSIRLTNIQVTLDPGVLGIAAGVGRATIVNDFGAIAAGIGALPPESTVPCGGGARAPGAPLVVLGPGTGLGVAIAVPGPAGPVVVPGEGGHADLAPVDEEELAAWDRLRRAHGRVSAETVLCGPGLSRLHAALADGAVATAEEITEAARRGEAAAARTVAVFTRWLGRVAGNLALTAGARGGVYLAGGVLPRWGALFDARVFRRAFEDKPPYAAWLREIPSHVVTHPQPGLVGLAELAHAGR